MKRKKRNNDRPATVPARDNGETTVCTTDQALYIAAFVVGIFAFLTYLPALGNGFISEWDDSAYVVGNSHIRTLSPKFWKWAFSSFHAANWHPVTWVSHALDMAVWGLSPIGHHFTSVIIHAINSCLVTLLTSRLFLIHSRTTGTQGNDNSCDRRALAAALVTGLLFAVHPLHVESVAWVAERKDVLCALFFLLSTLAYTAYNSALPQRGLKDPYLYLSLLSFAAALMAKPMAISLPAVLLILDWYPFRRLQSPGNLGRVLLEKLPFVVLSAISSAITIMAQKSGGAMSLQEKVPLSSRLLVAAHSLFAYIGKIIFPVGLSPFYPYPPQETITIADPRYLAAVAVAACIVVVLLLLFRKGVGRLLQATAAYYLVTLLPVLGIIQVGTQSMADRYMYLPSIGPFLMVGVITATAWGKKKSEWVQWLAALWVAAVLVLFALSVRQISVWKDNSTFWNRLLANYSRTVGDHPDDYSAYYNRGCIYNRGRQFDRAILDLNKAIELKPDYAEAYAQRGNAYLMQDNIERAMQDYSTAIAKNPSQSFVYANRAVALGKKGDIPGAIAEYAKALSLNPDYTILEAVYLGRGDLYIKSGRLDLGLHDYQQACDAGMESGCQKLDFPFALPRVPLQQPPDSPPQPRMRQ